MLKGETIGWPRGETADDIFAVGNARPLDQALQHATTEMSPGSGGLRPRSAGGEPSARPVVRYDIANVFNPAYSVACRVSKRWLQALER